jgi:hypothetical protein
MPITDLSDDALQHVIQTVGWPAAYRLGRVSRQFLRACQRCPNWVAAERSRLRSHGAHLRGFVLKLRIAISIVTDKTPDPPKFVPWEERPRDQCWKKLSETVAEESFKSELDVELPLWRWNEAFQTDSPRAHWSVPRPPGLPPPILGAMAYKLQLLNVTLVQRRDFAGRERRREFKVKEGCLEHENELTPPTLLMDFVQLDLQAGEGPRRERTQDDMREFICWPRLAERVEYAFDDWELELNREDRPCGRVLDDDLLKQIQMGFLAGRDFRDRQGWPVRTPHLIKDLLEFAEGVQYELRVETQYNLHKNKFDIFLHLGDDPYSYNLVEDRREGPAYIWGLLGHAPSATAFVPFSQRRQASRLSAWLRSANAS